MPAATAATYGQGTSDALPQEPVAMSPIAAYYVMVATDHDMAARRPRHQFAVRRRSILERVASALESLFSIGRPTSAQPI